MIKATCISKNMKNGKAESYILQDDCGTQTIIPADALKMEIRAGNITVTNLTLTSDNRLIAKTEKPYIQATCLARKAGKEGRITYILQDVNGVRIMMPEHVVRNNIKSGKLAVNNLALTPDGRIVLNK